MGRRHEATSWAAHDVASRPCSRPPCARIIFMRMRNMRRMRTGTRAGLPPACHTAARAQANVPWKAGHHGRTFYAYDFFWGAGVLGVLVSWVSWVSCMCPGGVSWWGVLGCPGVSWGVLVGCPGVSWREHGVVSWVSCPPSEDDAALSHNKANQGQPRPTKAHQGPTGPLISGADQRPPPSCSSTSVTLL